MTTAAVLLVDQIRRVRGLPAVNRARRLTRELKRQVAAEAWSKYPGALTREDFALGEFTLALVQREINQRLLDIQRGVVARQAALKDYF